MTMEEGVCQLMEALVLLDIEPMVAGRSCVGEVRQGRTPSIFHLTHWKAGSQWIYRILHQCVFERIVKPELGNRQFTGRPIEAGRVYPTLYVTKEEFDRAVLPADWIRFVVIRDLRDTLISGYFSWKYSHPLLSPGLERVRAKLQAWRVEDGLLYMADEWLASVARIQASWLAAGDELIRYEDLLDQDLDILEPMLLDRCGLPVSRERFRQVVVANRFESRTQGRQRGEENVMAHERKGIAGDWRNYFTDKVKSDFKARYAGLLIATGYEQDHDW